MAFSLIPGHDSDQTNNCDKGSVRIPIHSKPRSLRYQEAEIERQASHSVPSSRVKEAQSVLTSYDTTLQKNPHTASGLGLQHASYHRITVDHSPTKRLTTALHYPVPTKIPESIAPLNSPMQ